MSKTVTMRIDEQVLEKFSAYAKLENRSLSNFIETATLKYINEIEMADESETVKIYKNKKLHARLKKGSDDANNRRGRFVEVQDF